MGGLLSTHNRSNPFAFKKKEKKNESFQKIIGNEVVVGKAVNFEESHFINNNLDKRYHNINCPEDDLEKRFFWISKQIYDKDLRSFQEVEGYSITRKINPENENCLTYWLCKPKYFLSK